MNASAMNLNQIENRLEYNLKPVQPNEEFIRRLRNRLVSSPGITVEQRNNRLLGLLIMTGALFSGVFLVWVTSNILHALRRG